LILFCMLGGEILTRYRVSFSHAGASARPAEAT
jgi:hypothetical protein